MFPQLPTLPPLQGFSTSLEVQSRPTTNAIINSPGSPASPGGSLGGAIGGVLGGILGGSGGSQPVANLCTIFPTSPGCVKSTISGSAGVLSSALGIPAINWGRIAAFILGLILIAGGLYLIKPVQEIVNRTVKETVRSGAEVAAA